MEQLLAEAEQMGIKELQHELSMKLGMASNSVYYADKALSTACTPKQWMDALVLRTKLAWASGERYNLEDLRMMARKGDLTSDAWALLGMDYLHAKDYRQSLHCLRCALTEQSSLCWLVAILSVICGEKAPDNLDDEDVTAWLEKWNQCRFLNVVSNESIPAELKEEVEKAILCRYLKPVIRVPWSRVQQETGIKDSLILPTWAHLRDGIVYCQVP